ncbi:MAG: T9SS type A sorting domain-containing protein [Bacteroidetes bacterium]|nr:T9SS type A sorting domain-containing protein [Bacteroidota bacterium]
MEITIASKVTVMNALGQVVIAEMFEVGKHTVDINNESPGVYFVKVITNNKQQIIKIVKE